MDCLTTNWSIISWKGLKKLWNTTISSISIIVINVSCVKVTAKRVIIVVGIMIQQKIGIMTIIF